MLNHKANQLQRWRTKLHNNRLASQISTVLLQRHNWSHLLQNLKLSSKLTSTLFLHILRRTQPNPQISLQFYLWTKSHLGFEPDLEPASLLLKIILGSGLTRPAKPIVDRLVRNYPSLVLADSMVEACQGSSDSLSLCLGSILETYGNMGLFRDALQVFDKMRAHGFNPSITACNDLLCVMHRENETRLAWCFYGALIRDGVSPNRFTWSLIARIFDKSGKPERVAGILEMGVYSSEIYRILVGFLSKDGNFGAAFDRLREMSGRKLDPGFSTLSSILDGACRHENPEAIERIMNVMVDKKLISKGPLREYDKLIEKLCGLGQSYAAEMFFTRAIDKKIALKDTTYGYMIRALSIEGRRERAIGVFRLISEKKGVVLDDDTRKAFSRVILEEEQCGDVPELIMDIVRRGSRCCGSEVSEFLAVLCRKRKWKEAEEMVSLVLDGGVLPDSFACCSLVEHYCSTGRLDSAVALHDRIEKSGVCLDTATYNVLLDGLVAAGRVEEAVAVFERMRDHERVSSEGYAVVIRGLCGVGELRKAMKLHDEMLKLGHKPDEVTYKKLILAFK